MVLCGYCKEPIEGEPVRLGGKVYCCEACAFQGSLKKGSICGSPSSLGASLAYTQQRSREKP